MKRIIPLVGIAILSIGGIVRAVAAQTTPPPLPPETRQKTPSVLDETKAESLSQQADGMMKAGKYKDAIEVYNQILQLDDTSADAYLNRGIAKFQTGDKHGAIDDFTKAIEIDPSNVEAYNQRGGVYLIMGNKRKARQDFQQAARITNGQGSNPDAPPNPDAVPQQ